MHCPTPSRKIVVGPSDVKNSGAFDIEDRRGGVPRRRLPPNCAQVVGEFVSSSSEMLDPEHLNLYLFVDCPANSVTSNPYWCVAPDTLLRRRIQRRRHRMSDLGC